MVLHNFTRSLKALQKIGATKRSTQWGRQVDTGNHLQKAKEKAKVKERAKERETVRALQKAKAKGKARAKARTKG